MIDKNDIDSIIVQVPENWWITAESCKYMLACFVHKSNPDLNIDPKAAPAGATRESGRKVKKAERTRKFLSVYTGRRSTTG